MIYRCTSMDLDIFSLDFYCKLLTFPVGMTYNHYRAVHPALQDQDDYQEEVSEDEEAYQDGKDPLLVLVSTYILTVLAKY